MIFKPNGSPFSTTFDDIYFDNNNGYQQSKQVFIDGNLIKNKLLSADKTFTIGETGFGTGLNFFITLLTYQTLLKNKNKSLANLHFISTEKFPLTREQISTALAIFPGIKPFVIQMLESYPQSPQQGEQTNFSFFNGKVTMTLYFDDACAGLQKLTTNKLGLVDAWYLDGFSPSKNPEMWTNELFEQLARLSKQQATLATFTTAGFVRRGLIKVGFRLYKKTTDGHKKEATMATFQSPVQLGKGYQVRPRITKPMHVSIIGGGIASACLAYQLTKKGIKVDLYCQDDTPAQGASSNVIGALFPLIHQQPDDISLFYQQAFWRAREVYDELLQQGFHFEHQWCGLLEISYKEALKKRQQQFERLNAWDPRLITSITAQQASCIANIELTHGGLFMPEAGWISPPELVSALLSAASSTHRLRLKNNIKVSEVKETPTKNAKHQPSNGVSQQWQLTTNVGVINVGTLVICAGADSNNIQLPEQLPLSAVRGQITNLSANNANAKLNTVICHKGYLTPALNGVQCIGATFDKNTTNLQTRPEDDNFNFTMLATCLPELPQWQTQDIISSKARLRAMTPDHLPMVGALPKVAEQNSQYHHLTKDKNWRYQAPAAFHENLYVLTGLGARGLCSAPLLADILTADLTGEPYPVDNNMLFNLSSNRFVIRDLIKRKNIRN